MRPVVAPSERELFGRTCRGEYRASGQGVHIAHYRHLTVMQQIILTCTSCGKTKSVDDDPESKRDVKCDCGAPMVEKRSPGTYEDAELRQSVGIHIVPK